MNNIAPRLSALAVEPQPGRAGYSARYLIGVGGIAALMTMLAGDWLPGLSVVVLAASWSLVRVDEGPPVLAIALTTQWLQVTSALFYEALFGRRILSMDMTDYRPMVLIGLGCIFMLAVGIRLGMRWGERNIRGRTRASSDALPLSTCVPAYLLLIPLLAILEIFAWSYPGLNQPVLALSMIRYVLLFLILRKLVHPKLRLGWFFLILTAEVVFGMTGFFAGYREPIFFAALALLERARENKKVWAVLGVIAVMIFGLSLVWTAIKGDYRQQYVTHAESLDARIRLLSELSSRWFELDVRDTVDDLDRLVDRMWPIYYPAMAVNTAMDTDRPPLGGELLADAVRHVLTPRILFPQKEALRSDSEMVREFAGVMVASDESETSIAFGYAPELYLDLGLPLMFLPVLFFGGLMGAAYTFFLRKLRHTDLAVAVVTVIFWLTLYLFERSLVRTLGLALTLLFYVGIASFVMDRWISTREMKGGDSV